ncbi:MAG: hypothetical protein M3250_02795, partial [Thermoproteota archaeon]|nr:hypothetical protein [Thermoproteota archaeon]
MFSHIKLTKELKLLLFNFGIISLLYFALLDYYYDTLHVQAQQQQQQKLPPVISIKITSPTIGQQVPVGQLTISGTSSDNPTTDCTVYADWNNTKPFQKAIATGPGGVNDYSTWTFTYTDKYHLITNGTNNLTSKLSCLNNNGTAANITKNYSVNVIGAIQPSQRQASSVAEQQSNLSGGITSLQAVMEDNNTNSKTTTSSPELTPSVPITPSPESGGKEDTTIYW